MAIISEDVLLPLCCARCPLFKVDVARNDWKWCKASDETYISATAYEIKTSRMKWCPLPLEKNKE